MVTLTTQLRARPRVLNVRQRVHSVEEASAPSRGSPRSWRRALPGSHPLRVRAHQCGLDADAFGRLEGQREVPPLEEKPQDRCVSGPGRATSPPIPAALTAAPGPPAPLLPS